MWTRKLLKENGRVAFRRNYFTCVIVCLLAGFLGAGASANLTFNFNMGNGVGFEETENLYGSLSIEEILNRIPPIFWTIFLMVLLVSVVVVICLTLLVSNVVIIGKNRYFLENRESKSDVMQLFYAFREGRYSTSVWLMFLREVYIFGWSLLLWIPGIIKRYSYMLVPYILAENPTMDRKRVFALSEDMMRGHRWEAFVLSFSFIGWHLLSVFTAGLLSTFYVNPYIEATFAEFYSALKAKAYATGKVQEGELPGVTPKVNIEM